MSKFLKFIVHFVIICTIAIVLGLALPPFFGVKTVIVDNKNKETNLAMGSVTYAIPVKTETVNAGAPILVQDGEGTYRYNLVSVDRQTNTGVAIDPEATASENINVSVKNWVPKVVVTVPLIGYLMAAQKAQGNYRSCSLQFCPDHSLCDRQSCGKSLKHLMSMKISRETAGILKLRKN